MIHKIDIKTIRLFLCFLLLSLYVKVSAVSFTCDTASDMVPLAWFKLQEALF